MELVEVIDFIKTRSRMQYVNTHHSDIRCEQRNLSLDLIIDKIKNDNFVGIINQEGNVYELLISYNIEKDLRVILKIDGEKIILITTHLISSFRRKKNEKKQ